MSFRLVLLKLKRTIWNDALVQSWKEVLEALELIPQIPFESIHKGLSPEEIASIRAAGCVVVKGAVPVEEAVSWKADIKSYVAANPGQVKAKSVHGHHPNILETQRALLSLWRDGSGEVRLDTPISYFDRLRIRFPGDAKFTLGPHVDGGCFHNILSGAWKSHNPYDAAPRVHAVQDLYSAPSPMFDFPPWQGWTAMSSTGPGEGTLRVLPTLSLATAYWVLRPFFRARDPTSSSLKWKDWNELISRGLDSPGADWGPGWSSTTQRIRTSGSTRQWLSMPRVEPGDQGHHGGKEDSSVMYIPAVPLTLRSERYIPRRNQQAHFILSVQYLRDQRTNFLAGLPAPDFPGGSGESAFVGRATVEDVYPGAGQRAVGFEKFETAGESGKLFAEANSILAF
ncbi:DUF1479-domain-containing protein [Mycena olivaceomarginata]|nr:DUF1479-domain-containing protein [Mycena olivaceomarginata]